MEGEAVVHDYLGRLQAAAWPLGQARRSELIGEVREHIQAALGEAGADDEVTVRNVLERLGPPEEIVAAEVESGETTAPPFVAQPAAPTAPASTWGAIEIIALLLLTVGSVFLPFIGPIFGLVFAWASTRWTTREKLIATAIVAALILVPVAGLLAAVH